MSQFNDVRSAYEGTFVVNDTNELILNCDAYFVTADAVIASLEINEGGVDFKGSYIAAPAANVPAGTWLFAKRGDFFSAITLTSGIVTAYTKKPLPDGT